MREFGKGLVIIASVLMLAIFTVIAASAAPAPAYHKITAEEAKQRIDSGRHVVIVDVRMKDEFEAKRVKGAILIPNSTITNKMPKELPDLNAEILVYCRSNMGSREASDKLAAIGYKNVYDFGSFREWKYDTESGPTGQ